MKCYVNPPKKEWNKLTERVVKSDEEIAARVQSIIARVRKEGDKAIVTLTAEIDGVQLQQLEVSKQELDEAEGVVSELVKRSIATAVANITTFHEAQRYQGIAVETSQGVTCWQKSVPIQRVGLYIPGGTAPLFSTVLMLAVPARIAGCKEVILCTPTNKQGQVSPEVLYAARYCGINHIYKVGGAQAIAAMAYGTESVAPVDKIFGPGNRYVTKAKQIVSMNRVAIDMQAGPSEVLVLADDKANPAFVAADLLSQAEHGADSQVILVCASEAFAGEVSQQVDKQLVMLPRNGIALQALQESRMIVFSNEDDRIAFANEYAAEHLIVATDEPWRIAEQITAAGSVFLGHYSPESAGDYASGTNHTLPTSGWARACSGVNLDSFVRKITYQQLSQEGLAGLSETIISMAEAEGLQAHANAVKIRLNQ